MEAGVEALVAAMEGTLHKIMSEMARTGQMEQVVVAAPLESGMTKALQALALLVRRFRSRYHAHAFDLCIRRA